MRTPRRTVPHISRRHGLRATGLALAAVLALTACSGDAGDEGSTGDDETATSADGLTTGIPETWAAAIDDGKERYPEIGSQGQGDFEWDCPFTDTVHVDGETMDSTMTTFWKLGDDTFEVECGFYPPTPASLLFAQAGDDSAFAELVESTDAFEQSGNEQVHDEITVGDREYVVVTWTYPTNPAAGTRFVACYLDEETLSRACLDVADSDERSADYDAEQAAEDLSAVLTG